MEWTEYLKQIVYFPFLQIGEQPITALHLIVLFFVGAITIFFSRWLAQFLERRLPQYLDVGSRYTIIRLSQYLLWVLAFLGGLKILNIDLTGLTVVAGALGLGLGFGLQSTVANFVAGLILLFERPVKVGDRVTIENIEGNVMEIKFRATIVRTNDNLSIIVPNSEFVNGRVINWSLGKHRVRIHIPVGVAYGSDVQKVRQALLDVASENPSVMRNPEPEVWFVGFGDSSLNFELLVWINQPRLHQRLRSELNFAIDSAFRGCDIQIPFPQRDLHIKSAPAPILLSHHESEAATGSGSPS